MEKIGRQRRSESAWRELVERHEQSGLTVAEFCEREGLGNIDDGREHGARHG